MQTNYCSKISVGYRCNAWMDTAGQVTPKDFAPTSFASSASDMHHKPVTATASHAKLLAMIDNVCMQHVHELCSCAWSTYCVNATTRTSSTHSIF